MPKKLPLFSLLLLSFVWFACKKVDIQFGDQFLDNGYTQVVRVDTFTADLSTVLLDSFVTSAKGVTLIGDLNDPVFGKASVRSYFEVAPPTYVDSFANTTFDSLAVLLVPDKSYYGDTSRMVHINVHRLSGAITNSDNDLTNLYNTQNFPVFPSPIGSKDTYVRPLRADTIKVRLDDATGRELLGKMQNANDIDVKSNTAFINYFKGLRISSDGNSPLSFGCKDSVIMRLYYKKPGLYLQGKTLDFTLPNKAHHFNSITADRSGTALKDLSATRKEINSTLTGNIAYTSYLFGVMAKMRFPSASQIANLPNFTKILKASLIIRPVRGTYAAPYYLPPLLRLSTTNILNAIGNDLAFSSSGIATSQTGGLVLDNLTGELTNYAYDLTAYIKSAMTDATLSTNALLVIPPSPALETNFNRVLIGNKFNAQNKTQLVIVYAAVQ